MLFDNSVRPEGHFALHYVSGDPSCKSKRPLVSSSPSPVTPTLRRRYVGQRKRCPRDRTRSDGSVGLSPHPTPRPKQWGAISDRTSNPRPTGSFPRLHRSFPEKGHSVKTHRGPLPGRRPVRGLNRSLPLDPRRTVAGGGRSGRHLYVTSRADRRSYTSPGPPFVRTQDATCPDFE